MSVEVTRDEYDFESNSPTQFRFYNSRAREVLMSSGLGKGKTRVLCEKADLMCRLYPFNQVSLSRKTLASMWTSTIACLLDRVIDDGFRSRAWRPHAPGAPTLFYPNGSRLMCFGLDDPGRALSTEFGHSYIDQAEELDEQEGGEMGINGRLRLATVPWRQWGGVVNPREPTHWLCRRFRPDLVSPGGLRREFTKADVTMPDGEVIPKGTLLRECIVSGKADNYGNLPTDYKLTISQTRGRYRMRLVDGLWVAFEGMVYDHWNYDVHTIDRPKEWPAGYPPAAWPRYRVIDFGFDHPFVCQWWAKDPNTDPPRYYLYREIYHSRRDIEEQRLKVLELERREKRAIRQAALEALETVDEVRAARASIDLEPEVSVADHDRGEREYLERRGVPTDPAKKDVLGGIQIVYQMLNLDVLGRPRLLFLRDALDEPDPYLEENRRPTCTIEAMPGYRWKPAGPSGVGKEEPIKVDDDGPDAVRMLFDSLEEIGDEESE